jgi:hypothetical protein
MSIAELKEKVASLSRKDRFQLSVFLADLEQEGEAGFQKEASRRMLAMDAGKKVTAEEFEARHKKALSKGR